MRAAVLLSLLLFPVAAAGAQPDLSPHSTAGFADTGPNRPALSLSPRQPFNGVRHDRDSSLLLGGEPATATAQSAISFMPATFDPHALPGGRRKQHPSPRYRIGVMRLFGGSLGGSIGTRSASVSMSWQTDR